MILYIENPKDITRKLLELFNEYSKFSGYKNNTYKSLAFLYTSNEKTESETKETIPFTIAMKRIKYLATNDKWIRKLWYIYTMDYYSAIKKNTLESVLMRWMKLEPIMLSEVNQKHKHNTVYQHIYMEFRNMVMITLYARQKKRHRCIEHTFGLCGRRRGWDDLREQH